MKHCPDCGAVLSEADKRRSVPQLKRYWALVKAAWHHWPETHPEQFDSLDRCRKWLQCKAGHYETQRIEVPSTDPAVMKLVRLATEESLKAAGADAWVKPFGDCLVIFKPKSIAFHSLSHAATCRLFDEVEAVIYAEIGLKGEQLLKEHERAA